VIIKFDWERFKTVANERGDTTLEDMSARTGIDIGVLSRLRNDKRQPTLRTAKIAALAYNRPLDDLITVKDAA
jgi:transcriptional regulator with XRE-family HTH domain